MKSHEFIIEETTTLQSLYGDNYPDRYEDFWDWVRPGELELPLTVQTLSKHKLLIQLLSQYRAEHIDEIVDLLNDNQRNIIRRYRSDPNLSNKIIVIAANRIIDGNHRALAAALNGSSIKYVDLAELDKENLTEDSNELYHGTLLSNVQSILANGLNPTVGEFTKSIYADKAKPLVFAADINGSRTVYCTLASQIGMKLGKFPPTAEEIAKHGALLVISKDVGKFRQYNSKRRQGSKEPTDYTSQETIHIDRVITGKELLQWIKTHNADRGEMSCSNDNQQGVAEANITSDDLTTEFIEHYNNDPVGMFMHAKSSYLDAVGKAKNFSVYAAKLSRSHESMSKNEFQDTVIKHFGVHLKKHGWPKHASPAWGEAEYDLIKELSNGVAEGVPQPGKSSGKPISWISPERAITKYLTLDEILNSVQGIPYYNEVVKDRDAKDFTWGVTKKVIEYAIELIVRPDAYKNWPPIIVVDGKLQDGAHRISTINLMQKRVQPNNTIWKNAKLKVEFGKSDNVRQGVAEGHDDSSFGTSTSDEYSRVLRALDLYYPRLSMEELNVPGYHKVIANKANVPVGYAAQVINDFVKASGPNDDDWLPNDKQDMTEARKKKRKNKKSRAMRSITTGWWGWPGDNSSAEGYGGGE